MPEGTGKGGRRVLLGDVGGVKKEGDMLIVLGRNGSDVLFEGRYDDGTDGKGKAPVSRVGKEEEGDAESPIPVLHRCLTYILKKGIPAETLQENEEAKGAIQQLQDKATKASYFAKREQEMKEKAKAASERKSKYLKESGGMKYTALAMTKM